MIPILYAANETTFSHNGIGRLVDCTECVVTEERNGIYECEFSYPITGQFYSEISLDRIIKAKPNDGADDQLFRIYRINRPINGIVSVYCQHISYDLAVNIVLPFSLINDSAINALTGIFSHLSTTSNYTYTVTSTVGGTNNFKVETPISARAAIGGAEGSVLDVFGGELEFDNFNIKLHQHRGQDSGVTILYGKNLTDIKTDTNMTNSYTAILPYAVDEGDDTPVHLIDGNTKTIAISGAPTYGEPRVLAVDLTDRFDLVEEDITAAALAERANDYLAENDLKTISQNIEISFVQLWQTEEYKNIALLERVALCDTVTVRYEKLGVDATAKVVKTVYDTINEKYESIEIGDAKSNFLETLRKEAKEQGKKAVKENYSAMQAAINNATELITGQSGGHVILKPDANGKPQEILIMDTEDIQTATKVWRWNLGGLGYAHGTNAYNGQYTTAITMDGAIVADFITTGTLNASVITAGVLQDAQGKNYWNLNNGNFRLSQYNALNSLTHDGDTQGIYMVPVQGEDYNELRINANYIKSGTIDAGVVNVTNINANNINAGIIRDQTNATAKNYWNLSTGEFRLTAGTKVYKDDGTDSGIFYKASGELRINADYIKTGTLNAGLIKAGTLESVNGVTSINMSTGNVSINQSTTGQIMTLDDNGIKIKYNGAQVMSINSNSVQYSINGKSVTLNQSYLWFSNGASSVFLEPNSSYSALKTSTIELSQNLTAKSITVPYSTGNNSFVDFRGLSYQGKQLSQVKITVNGIDYVVLGYQTEQSTNRLVLNNTSYNGCAFETYRFSTGDSAGTTYYIAAYNKSISSSATDITSYNSFRRTLSAIDNGTHWILTVGMFDSSIPSSQAITEMVDSSGNVYTSKLIPSSSGTWYEFLGY